MMGESSVLSFELAEFFFPTPYEVLKSIWKTHKVLVVKRLFQKFRSWLYLLNFKVWISIPPLIAS